MFCFNCRAPINAKMEVCPSCGQKLITQDKKKEELLTILPKGQSRFSKTVCFFSLLGIVSLLALLYTIRGDDEEQGSLLQQKEPTALAYREEQAPPLSSPLIPLKPDISPLPSTEENPSEQRREENEKKIIAIIDQQLAEMRAGEFSKAYEEHTSVEFRQATSFDDFQAFLKAYPILTQNQLTSYGDLMFQEDGKATIMVILKSESLNNPVEYSLIKENNEWKIYGFRVIVQQTLSAADRGAILAIFNEQLAAIKAGDLSKAYSYVSQEFQKATPLSAFVEFIHSYPIFKDFQNSKFTMPEYDEHNLVAMSVTLNNAAKSSEVDYRFIKEDNQWKIWSMDIIENKPPAPLPIAAKSEELTALVEGQLAAIREGNIEKSYQEFTSDEFKEATSLEQFEQFVHKNPVIGKNKSSHFFALSFEEGVAIAEGTLTATSGEVEKIKYRFIHKENGWKILSINILYSFAPSKEEKMEVTKVLLGTETDLNGIVTNPMTTLTSPESKITANIYVHNVTRGAKVEVLLEHLESRSTIPLATTTLEKNGDSVVSFIFTPPSQGWPKGHYKLTISPSATAETTTTFTME